ncbi:unnamed protein product, partial [Prorocentrum cordatum]
MAEVVQHIEAVRFDFFPMGDFFESQRPDGYGEQVACDLAVGGLDPAAGGAGPPWSGVLSTPLKAQ